MYLKKYVAGISAVIMILANNPQVSADEVEIFGQEFETETPKPAAENNPPPVVVNEQPAVVNEEPVVVNEEPVTVNEEPVTVNEQPAVVNEEPVVVNEQPVVVNEEPVVVNEEPTVVNEQPVVVNEQPVAVNEQPAQTQPVAVDNEEDFGDTLNFNRINNQPEPSEVFAPDDPIDEEQNNNNVRIVNNPRSDNEIKPATSTATAKPKSLKNLPQRFVEVGIDENYIYYLDKQSVTWKKIPYMNSEYMADVWIRMIERNSNTDDMPTDLASYVNDENTDEIALAKAKGYQYMSDDIKVLKHKKYFLEHYYLRPQRDQVQFLCELEVVGHPQNTASQRKYNQNNWEDLIPGSMESVLYHSVIQIIGKGKASDKGHMTFADIFEEYARISIR